MKMCFSVRRKAFRVAKIEVMSYSPKHIYFKLDIHILLQGQRQSAQNENQFWGVHIWGWCKGLSTTCDIIGSFGSFGLMRFIKVSILFFLLSCCNGNKYYR